MRISLGPTGQMAFLRLSAEFACDLEVILDNYLMCTYSDPEPNETTQCKIRVRVGQPRPLKKPVSRETLNEKCLKRQFVAFICSPKRVDMVFSCVSGRTCLCLVRVIIVA